MQLSSYYRIISSGQVLPGFDSIEVTQQLQDFFYINHQQARSMLNSQQQVVHEQLDYASASSIVKQLTGIGLQVHCQRASDLIFPKSIQSAEHLELKKWVNTRRPESRVRELIPQRLSCDDYQTNKPNSANELMMQADSCKKLWQVKKSSIAFTAMLLGLSIYYLLSI